MAERELMRETWTNPKGEAFRVLHWKSSTPTQAALIIHHGLGEHAGRYDTFDVGLRDVPVDIIAYDCRGHGESHGARGGANGLGELASDLDAIFPFLVEKTGAKAAVLFGHSMGAATVATYLLNHKPHDVIRGFVLSAPPIKIFRNLAINAKLGVGKVLGTLAPGLTLPTGLDPHGVSSVPAEVRRYIEDPLIHDKISAALGVSVVDDAERLIDSAERITLPALLYHGTDDPIANIEGTRAFARALGSEDKTIQEFEGMRHETHHESEEDRAKVFALLGGWLREHLDLDGEG